jgi:alpha 1,3-glucosidase
MRPLGFTALVLCLFLITVVAVKQGDFKSCSQSGFCRRGRALSARAKASPDWRSPYSVDASSVAIASDQASFIAVVKSSIYPAVKFGLEVKVHNDGVVRVRMDEVDGLRKRYDEAASWALVTEPRLKRDVKWSLGKRDLRVLYGDKKDIEVIVTFEPLKISLKRNGKEQVVLNGEGLLHMEHFRVKPPHATVPEDGTDESESKETVMRVNPAAWFEGDSEDAWWEEAFLSWTDSKPKGIAVLIGLVSY